MKTFYWLVKREFWEHRGSFLWTPVITTGVVLVINILSVIAGEVIGGRHFDTGMMWQQLATANPEDISKVGALLDLSALLPCIIVSVVLFFVLYGYCMKSLSSDRADRSILFWKSLPVSDLSTVLSKVFSAVIVAPVIAVIVSILGAIGMLLIFGINGAIHGVGFGEVVWGLAHPGRIITSMAGLLPIYMIWMLPCVGWLMLCSAWSKGKVARWAIALPIGVGVIITWLGAMTNWFGSHTPLGGATDWFWKHIVLRILVSLFPGSWAGSMHDMATIEYSSGSGWHTSSFAGDLLSNVGQQYHLLLTPQFLWGILAGAVMIAIAIWLRRWRTEL